MERVVALGSNFLHGKESKEKKPSIWGRYSRDRVIFFSESTSLENLKKDDSLRHHFWIRKLKI